MNNYRPSLVTGPTVEPVTVEQAKLRLQIAATDHAHDEHIAELISECREEFEADSDSLVCQQTWKLETEVMSDGMQLYKSPVQSVTSVTYYDTAGTLHTLPTTVWDFDKTNRKIFLKPDQIWPVTQKRWDAWVITYVCGYSTVPAVVQKAILLLVENYFLSKDPTKESEFKSYNRLVNKLQRSTYP